MSLPLMLLDMYSKNATELTLMIITKPSALCLSSSECLAVPALLASGLSKTKTRSMLMMSCF